MEAACETKEEIESPIASVNTGKKFSEAKLIISSLSGVKAGTIAKMETTMVSAGTKASTEVKAKAAASRPISSRLMRHAKNLIKSRMKIFLYSPLFTATKQAAEPPLDLMLKPPSV